MIRFLVVSSDYMDTVIGFFDTIDDAKNCAKASAIANGVEVFIAQIIYAAELEVVLKSCGKES